jgi:hypothetical protein
MHSIWMGGANCNKDQKGKGNIPRTQPPSPPRQQSRAPRRHQTKTGSEHDGGERKGTRKKLWKQSDPSDA